MIDVISQKTKNIRKLSETTSPSIDPMNIRIKAEETVQGVRGLLGNPLNKGR